MTRAGVYMILCTTTGQRYIGASANLEYRKQKHLSYLKGHTHQSKRLQAVYDAHGVESFVWQVVQAVESESPDLTELLAVAEMEWLESGFLNHPGLMLNSRPVRYQAREAVDHPPEFFAWLALVQQRLREEREKRGLSYRGVEETTGVPFASVSRAETGRNVPTLPFLFALAKGYGIPVTDLLCEKQKGKK